MFYLCAKDYRGCTDCSIIMTQTRHMVEIKAPTEFERRKTVEVPVVTNRQLVESDPDKVFTKKETSHAEAGR